MNPIPNDILEILETRKFGEIIFSEDKFKIYENKVYLPPSSFDIIERHEKDSSEILYALRFSNKVLYYLYLYGGKSKVLSYEEYLLKLMEIKL